jgi:hypothetical protein
VHDDAEECVDPEQRPQQRVVEAGKYAVQQVEPAADRDRARRQRLEQARRIELAGRPLRQLLAPDLRVVPDVDRECGVEQEILDLLSLLVSGRERP